MYTFFVHVVKQWFQIVDIFGKYDYQINFIEENNPLPII